MMRNLTSALLVGAFLLTVSACSLFSPETSLAPKHPEELKSGRPNCVECHEGQEIKGFMKPYASFNHTETFIKGEHRFASGRDQRVCAVCHATSFCNDCHATKIEMKPATKLGNRPDRELVHRGDYLTRHRIEGKIDPSSCYACHGRANNEKCMTCHR